MAFTVSGLPPLSLYIHIPWCIRKCPYCDFNSHAANGNIPEQEYVACLIEDLQRDLPLAQGRRLSSIFFGGGTPSLFSPTAIDAILRAAESHIGFSSNIEITLEANPSTFEQDKFSGYFQAGVNRLSIGIQSFDSEQLAILGRVHNSREAHEAIVMAKKAGFDNLNLDLMHALPNQTLAEALSDLQTALDYQTNHLSWYQLTIEPNTAFYSKPPSLPDHDLAADIQQAGFELLRQHGLQQYEVSAHAKPAQQSRHNLNYWEFGDYLGIGAGAHGKVTSIDQSGLLTVERFQKTRAPKDYLARKDHYLAKRHQLSQADLPVEFLLNALRLQEGVAPELFTERTGLALTHLQPQWDSFVSKGALQPLTSRIATTALGYRFLDSIIAEF